FQTLEPQAEAIALPVEDLDLTAGAIEEHEQHRVEYLHLDVQLDQSGQAVDGFAEVDGVWVEIDLLHLGVGTHHGMNSGENGSSASNDQQAMGRWGLWSGYGQTSRLRLCRGCHKPTGRLSPHEDRLQAHAWPSGV